MKKIVVTLGMGRCGTAIVCQALSRMGVDFGGPLLGPHKRNERGHWEHLPIKRTQIDMTFRCARVGGYLFRGPVGNMIDEQGEAALREIVAAEVERYPLFGFKEPLTARLIPMWTRIFAAIQVSPIYIASFREPDGVYRSLLHEGEAFQRDSVATRRGVALIWGEYAHAIRNTGALELWYEDWAEREENQCRLLADAVGWSGPLPRVYEPELRHA